MCGGRKKNCGGAVIEKGYIAQGDCLELMRGIPNKSVDMILCDLPYGVTACHWDTIIPPKLLWKEYKRIIKPHGAIVLFAKEPLSAQMIMSNLHGYKHKWVWNKKLSGSFHTAKYMPLAITEDILVFTANGEKVRYNPQMRKGKMRKRGGAKNTNSTMGKGFHLGYDGYSDEYYPTCILEYPAERKNRVHPTQKPLALCEYLIHTYSGEGDIVLDNCMGSGTVGIACVNTGREFIGFEIMTSYFEIAKERIKQAKREKEVDKNQKCDNKR